MSERTKPDDFFSLWEFFRDLYVPLVRPMPLKAFHEEICETIQAAILGDLQVNKTADNPEGDAPFIVVAIAPRVGKTSLLQAACAWVKGFFPDSQDIFTGYAGNIAEQSSITVRDKIILSPWYQDLFPETKLGVKRTAEAWSTSAGGNVFAEGILGQLLGKGGGLKVPAGGAIYVDDPAKPDEALSMVQAEALRFAFENTLLTRRNSSNWCPIIINAQRLADQDLPGYVMKEYKEQCHVIKVRALVNGVSIIPETRSTASLLKLQEKNPFAFSAMYQQEPIIIGGNMIKSAWFKYHAGEITEYEKKVITCDTAMMAKQHNDWTVLQCWGRRDGKAYLIDQVREKMLSPQMLSTAAEFFRKHNQPLSPVSLMQIEEAASGPALIQSLNVIGIPARGIKRLRDKVVRVEDILAFQMTGQVYFPKDESWLPDFEAELMGFRKDGLSEHDDQVDAYADGVKELLGSALSILDVL